MLHLPQEIADRILVTDDATCLWRIYRRRSLTTEIAQIWFLLGCGRGLLVEQFVNIDPV
jgi:hypothetical protein